MAHLAHYKEAHPLPFVIAHWVNLIAMIALILTGLYIHFPLFSGWMGVARGVHMFFALIIVINLLFRIVAMLFIKSSPYGGSRTVERDYKSFFPQRDNRHQLGAWVKYYLFLKKDHPLSGKYGVLQKMAYAVVPLLIIIMALSGLSIWGPTMDIGPYPALVELVGGPMNMRMIHFFMMWIIIVFTFVHVYLATIEGFAPVKIMFFRKESGGLTYDPDKRIITGEDKLIED